MDALSERIATLVARCRERHDDPAFQANAKKLAEDDREFAALSAEVERKTKLLQSGIPVSLWTPLATPRGTVALAAVRDHLLAPTACVFLTLSGTKGQGKTFAACWAVYSRGGRFVDAHDLVQLSTFDGEWMDLAREPVVAIDELGAEYLNDAYRANLYALLNRRYADERKTILCTNLAAPAFMARYCPGADDRLLDRLTKGGHWVNLAGESMRQHWSEKRDGE